MVHSLMRLLRVPTQVCGAWILRLLWRCRIDTGTLKKGFFLSLDHLYLLKFPLLFIIQSLEVLKVATAAKVVGR